MNDDQQPEKSGAPRPTGKRQLSGAATTTTQSYSAKQGPRAEDKSEGGPAGTVVGFPGQVVSEIKKVVWPTSKEMVQYTLITFAFLIVLTALVWGVDTLTGLGVEQVLTP
ncbi:preprotein translocase subunit SecE [Corynebacterium flavescens]|uniref:Protein translocase subunit SecE n=1 Tax=Corynebacterium flavescens TaxID=28028 RepID=A0A1L7CJN5_CORFL|nr:preprotein translocase subunit SecE [Corynebacterium flavescens]APT86080.1 preprotein translocase subunit SecE [Corynebacterium flavescens]KAA8724747.1 preprotein translocase subunit SecE [Corynebacterium flavescens]GEB98901.1 protein translocase subunit SecE [Corynebacterium flavescens]